MDFGDFLSGLFNHPNFQSRPGMSTSFLIGVMFTCTGMSLFMAQIATVELARAYRSLKSAIHEHFGHDTSVFPDHVQ